MQKAISKVNPETGERETILVDMTQEEINALYPPATIEQLKARAAAKRYEVETGGIVISGRFEIPTDTIAQNKIAAAKTAFDNGTLTGTIDFKAKNGWISANGATIAAIYSAVVNHVQASYAAEKVVVQAIDNGDILTTDEIDQAQWPSNS